MPPAIIDEVFIYFVGEHDQVSLNSNVAEYLQFGSCENLSGWVGRSTNDNRPGSIGASPHDVLLPETPIGRLKGNEIWHKPGCDQRAEVITVKGLKKDDLIAGIEQSHARAVQRARRSTGH